MTKGLKKGLLIASCIIIVAAVWFAAYWLFQPAPILIVFNQGVSLGDASKDVAKCVTGSAIARPAVGTNTAVIKVETNRAQLIGADSCLSKNAQVGYFLNIR